MYHKNGVYMVIIMLAFVFIWEFMVYAEARQVNNCYENERETHTEEYSFAEEQGVTEEYNVTVEQEINEEYGVTAEQEISEEYGVTAEQEISEEYGVTAEQKITEEYSVTAEQKIIEEYSDMKEQGTFEEYSNTTEFDLSTNYYDIPTNDPEVFANDNLNINHYTLSVNPVWNQQDFSSKFEAENILINLTKENNQVMIEKNVGVARLQVCKVLEKQYKYSISESEREMLERIVEAEACGEDIDGKKLVANVVLNRVQSKSFPNSIEEVIFQKDGGVYQFSPIYDGRYYSVTVSEESREAVEEVLLGEDNSEGALYFMSRNYSDSDKVKWFDRHLTKLFAYGGHEFFR